MTQRRLGAAGLGNPPQERNRSACVDAANGAVCGPFPPFARRQTMSRVYTTSAL